MPGLQSGKRSLLPTTNRDAGGRLDSAVKPAKSGTLAAGGAQDRFGSRVVPRSTELNSAAAIMLTNHCGDLQRSRERLSVARLPANAQ